MAHNAGINDWTPVAYSRQRKHNYWKRKRATNEMTINGSKVCRSSTCEDLRALVPGTGCGMDVHIKCNRDEQLGALQSHIQHDDTKKRMEIGRKLMTKGSIVKGKPCIAGSVAAHGPTIGAYQVTGNGGSEVSLKEASHLYPSESVLCRRHYKRKHSSMDRVTDSSYRCICRTKMLSIETRNPFSALYQATVKEEKKPTCCTKSKVLYRKCKDIARLLKIDCGLKPDHRVPKLIRCGGLRAAVRSMYGEGLTLVQLLSIKTSAKAESRMCNFCANEENIDGKVPHEVMVDTYVKKRLEPVEVDENALDEFSKAFRANIPGGWNKRKGPYIPNGHCTAFSSRLEGGNWNTEPFSQDCTIAPVMSSGKYRIVTMYSEHNVRVLTPLHNSLYSFLKRRKWLLVGSPTDDRLREMQSGCIGNEWLSFDYESATDNIKIAYVQRAIEILIDKGEGLTEDEIACLRVVGNLRLRGQHANTGQPMGSPMSFPILCLVNKTVVDLALTDLLIEGKIRFKEWSGHRCLINGDDLLTKGTSSGDLVANITKRGAQVGLKTNKEKTLRSTRYGEINSTVFDDCVKQQKTNVAALWMDQHVEDVLGYAVESSATAKGFQKIVCNNTSRLARQKIKTFKRLPVKKFQALNTVKIRHALASSPSSDVPAQRNLFPIVPMPDGFSITRGEMDEVIEREVLRVKENRLFQGLAAEADARRRKLKKVSAILSGSIRANVAKALRPHVTDGKKSILKIFACHWENKRKEELAGGCAPLCYSDTPYDQPRIQLMLGLIKNYKDKEKERQAHNPPSPPGDDPFGDGSDYVSLADV